MVEQCKDCAHRKRREIGKVDGVAIFKEECELHEIRKDCKEKVNKCCT